MAEVLWREGLVAPRHVPAVLRADGVACSGVVYTGYRGRGTHGTEAEVPHPRYLGLPASVPRFGTIYTDTVSHDLMFQITSKQLTRPRPKAEVGSGLSRPRTAVRGRTVQTEDGGPRSGRGQAEYRPRTRPVLASYSVCLCLCPGLGLGLWPWPPA